MKNHQIINGRRLQPNKKWSHLKQKQKIWISEMTKTAHENYILKHNKLPIRKNKYEVFDEVADKIDLADYDKVATIDLPDNDDILETVFMYGNTDKSKFNEIKPMRSISVSDIIEYDGAMYYVDNFGFKEL